MNILRLPKLLYSCVAFCCCQALTVSLSAQQQKVDTARTYSIPEVTVAEAYHTREVRAMAPTQVFSKEELKSLNVLQVSDAVKHFAGVTVKDYGGIGGLKTVSLRSLGAEHTAVGYDGITISDCQTGQIDIGRFSLDNVDRLSLSNGQSDNIFQPARFFASAGILNIQTLTPQFKDNRRTNLSASFKTGSWGLVNPSLLLDQKLSRIWVLSANGEWMSADGHYPFTLHYGEDNDLTSREKRKNTEVKNLRAEAGLFGNFSDTEQWRLKAYYYQSSRGLPNATTLHSISGIRMSSCKANTKKNSAANGSSRLRPNGTGATNVISTPTIKVRKAKRRTVIISKSITSRLRRSTGCSATSLFRFRQTRASTG